MLEAWTSGCDYFRPLSVLEVSNQQIWLLSQVGPPWKADNETEFGEQETLRGANTHERGKGKEAGPARESLRPRCSPTVPHHLGWSGVVLWGKDCPLEEAPVGRSDQVLVLLPCCFFGLELPRKSVASAQKLRWLLKALNSWRLSATLAPCS